MRGSIAIYRGAPEIDAASGKRTGAYALTECFRKPTLGPMIALAESDGYICSFEGPQLQITEFKNGSEFKKIGFVHTGFHCRHVDCFKNFILQADLFRGFGIWRFRGYGHKLIDMARDTIAMLPTSCAFITHERQMGGVVFDAFGNAQIVGVDEYAVPTDAFIYRPGFFVGHPVHVAGHLRQRRPDAPPEYALMGNAAWFASQYGRVGLFCGVRPDTARLFTTIQSQFERSQSGFAHDDYRVARWRDRVQAETRDDAAPRIIVDIDFLCDLFDGSFELQRQCVRATGKSIGEVGPLFTEIAMSTDFFI